MMQGLPAVDSPFSSANIGVVETMVVHLLDQLYCHKRDWIAAMDKAAATRPDQARTLSILVEISTPVVVVAEQVPAEPSPWSLSNLLSRFGLAGQTEPVDDEDDKASDESDVSISEQWRNYPEDNGSFLEAAMVEQRASMTAAILGQVLKRYGFIEAAALREVALPKIQWQTANVLRVKKLVLEHIAQQEQWLPLNALPNLAQLDDAAIDLDPTSAASRAMLGGPLVSLTNTWSKSKHSHLDRLPSTLVHYRNSSSPAPEERTETLQPPAAAAQQPPQPPQPQRKPSRLDTQRRARPKHLTMPVPAHLMGTSQEESSPLLFDKSRYLQWQDVATPTTATADFDGRHYFPSSHASSSSDRSLSPIPASPTHALANGVGSSASAALLSSSGGGTLPWVQQYLTSPSSAGHAIHGSTSGSGGNSSSSGAGANQLAPPSSTSAGGTSITMKPASATKERPWDGNSSLGGEHQRL